MRRVYTVAIFTGLRTSELSGLKWVDLEWTSDASMAVIKRSFAKHKNEHLTETPVPFAPRVYGPYPPWPGRRRGWCCDGT